MPRIALFAFIFLNASWVTSCGGNSENLVASPTAASTLEPEVAAEPIVTPEPLPAPEPASDPEPTATPPTDTPPTPAQEPIPETDTDPSITLNGMSVELVELGSVFIDDGVVAMDTEDGDISASVVVDAGSVDTSQIGDYFVTYSVTDSDQNTQVIERLVRVSDNGSFADRATRPISEFSNAAYFERLPSSYGEDPLARYPLLIYFHGIGEVGNDLSLLTRGQDFPGLIDPEQDGNEFLVVLPQRMLGVISHVLIDQYIDDMEARYQIDTNQIYIVGFSAGAIQLAHYLNISGRAERLAAAAFMAGFYDAIQGLPAVVPCNYPPDLPLWYFHGRLDTVLPVQQSIDIVNDHNACPLQTATPRLTVFGDGRHDIDDDILSDNTHGLGEPAFDLFDISLYEWFVSHSLHDR